MKNFNKASGRSSKQSGFFDLGISLLILAMAGSAVFITERNHDEKTTSLQESTEIRNEKVSKLDSDNTGFALP